MSANTKINTIIQSVKDSPKMWIISGIIFVLVTALGLWFNYRNTIATEQGVIQAGYTIQNDVIDKSDTKNPLLTFTGEIVTNPNSRGISVLMYNPSDKDIYFTGSYPVVIYILSDVGSGKTINWSYPVKINAGETTMIHGLFYGNGIQSSGSITIGCKFRDSYLNSEGKPKLCSVFGDKTTNTFVIPSLKDKKMIGIDASDANDTIDFELLEKDLSEFFLGTMSPGKNQGTGKITITQQCSSRGKRVFLFYNENIVQSSLLQYMKEELFRYYKRVGAIDRIEDIKEFTFADLYSPNYQSCEAHILDLVSDCAKTVSKDGKKNICSGDRNNFDDALKSYKTDYKKGYYSKKLVGPEGSKDIYFMFIIFANK